MFRAGNKFRAAVGLLLLAFAGFSTAWAGDDPLARWRPGLLKGAQVEGSVSPDGQKALFEIHAYDLGLPTTLTAIAVADARQTTLLGLTDVNTPHSIDKPCPDYLAIAWSPGSRFLALHDATAKQSVLRLYRVTAAGCAGIPLPDLRQAALDRLRLAAKSVTSSGQFPARWVDDQTLVVNVRLKTGRATRQAEVTLRIAPEGTVSILPN